MMPTLQQSVKQTLNQIAKKLSLLKSGCNLLISIIIPTPKSHKDHTSPSKLLHVTYYFVI